VKAKKEAPAGLILYDQLNLWWCLSIFTKHTSVIEQGLSPCWFSSFSLPLYYYRLLVLSFIFSILFDLIIDIVIVVIGNFQFSYLIISLCKHIQSAAHKCTILSLLLLLQWFDHLTGVIQAMDTSGNPRGHFCNEHYTVATTVGGLVKMTTRLCKQGNIPFFYTDCKKPWKTAEVVVLQHKDTRKDPGHYTCPIVMSYFSKKGLSTRR